jgi:hypothetical protein
LIANKTSEKGRKSIQTVDNAVTGMGFDTYKPDFQAA